MVDQKLVQKIRFLLFGLPFLVIVLIFVLSFIATDIQHFSPEIIFVCKMLLSLLLGSVTGIVCFFTKLKFGTGLKQDLFIILIHFAVFAMYIFKAPSRYSHYVEPVTQTTTFLYILWIFVSLGMYCLLPIFVKEYKNNRVSILPSPKEDQK